MKIVSIILGSIIINQRYTKCVACNTTCAQKKAYRTLGLEFNSSLENIEEKYKKLSLEYSKKNLQDEKISQEYQKIKEAYNLLKKNK